jgi:predicted extracellular nuclease
VASFNVLNFFTTIDDGPNVCGPTGMSDCRGADSQEEYERQLAKLLAGIQALDADVIGFQEVENDIFDDDGSRAHDAILTIVEELNAIPGAGHWAWVGEPELEDGTPYFNDYPIRNEVIYRTNVVRPVGPAMTIAHDAFDAPRPSLSGTAAFEPVGRPPLAQTFANAAAGRPNKLFTVVVNHFKSKGSTCDVPELDNDADLGDGQANCNLTRVGQAEVLMDFVADLQDWSGDDDVLIIGDLNSYGMEDPVEVIKDEGYIDLPALYEGTYSYTYMFDGQLGSLDHALASPSLLGQVRGALSYHINADEPDILDYDTTFKSDSQDALYEPLPYRTSDHDPVVIGLNIENEKAKDK